MVKSSENSIEAQPYNLIHNHPIFENILNDLFTSFKRNKAQSIGSTLLTNVAKKHCEVCMYVSFKVQKIQKGRVDLLPSPPNVDNSNQGRKN